MTQVRSGVTRIVKVLAVPATGAGCSVDLAALQARPLDRSERLTAPAVTPGFRAVSEVAEAVSVGLVLEGGSESSGRGVLGTAVVWGSCVGTAYGGLAGREPVFRAQAGMSAIERLVAPVLEGRELAAFRPLAAEVDALAEPLLPSRPAPAVDDAARRALFTAPLRAIRAASRPEAGPAEAAAPRPGTRLHAAVRYGVSQALLAAVALERGVTMAEVVADEWRLPPPAEPVPLHGQCGPDRTHDAERMIVRRLASLPHAAVDDVAEQVGRDGAVLTRYIRWLKERIAGLGGDDYRPTIHLDVQGALGQIYGHDFGRMLGQIFAWQTAAAPYRLRLECPVLLGSRQAQIEAMAKLRDYVRARRLPVELVADEWANDLDDVPSTPSARAFLAAGAADMIHLSMPDLGSLHNTIEAILACRAAGVGTLLGGSHVETDLAARVAVHVALGTRPDLLLARPGLGVDEAVSLTENEMACTLATIAARRPTA